MDSVVGMVAEAAAACPTCPPAFVQDEYTLFVPVAFTTIPQLIFLTCVYGYLLYEASNQISDGSELLLLVPAWSDLIGSVVLPVLGAVPDGLMILFSGVGPNVEETITVGVGALAGSTIMLLTIPWYLSLVGGRVDIVNHEPQYRRPRYAPESWCKLTPGNTGWDTTGVGVDKTIGQNALVMIATSLLYGVMQIPAFYFDEVPLEEKGAKESWFALFGCILCLAAFIGYIYAQMADNDATEQLVNEKRIDAIRCGDLSLCGAMQGLMTEYTKSGELDADTPLLALSDTHPLRKALSSVLIRFFAYYDINRDHKIDIDELRCIMNDMNEEGNQEQLVMLFNQSDTDQSGYIEFGEFVGLMLNYLQLHINAPKEPSPADANIRRTLCLIDDNDEDGEGEEEEDIPEDLVDLSPEQQQHRIKMRAGKQMLIGTVMVLLFSDPMVDILSEWGKRAGVSPFYVAFVLAPLASNAAELTAAYNYAQKKTQKSMSISLCTLEGAACMNNTFCLSIFYLMIWKNGLPWTYTAESISIVGVQVVMGYFASKRVTRFKMAYAILALYPLSLGAVYFMENYLGWD